MRPLWVRILAVIATYAGSLVVIAPVVGFVVLVIAGPHSDMLPHALQVAALVLGWLLVLAAPPFIAWKVWKRMKRT